MLDGHDAAPTPALIVPRVEAGGSRPHEHAPVLVELDFDVSGRAIREYACRGCASVWFE